jgi:anion transporter
MPSFDLSKKKDSTFEKWMKITGILIALVIFAAIYTMPTPIAMTVQTKSSMAVFFMVFVLWVTQAIPTYASALVALVMLVLTGGWDQNSALLVFGQDVIWLMLSAFIITAGMEKSGFAKRIALFIVSKFGTTTRKALLALCVVNLILAFVVPSTTARAAMLFPICLMILKVYKAVPGESNFGRQVMLQEIHANNITTSGILTATSGQILAVSYISSMGGADVTWGKWLIAGMPIAIATLIVSVVLGNILYKPEFDTPPTEAANTGAADGEMSIKDQYKALGKITPLEIKAIVIFVLTIFLWATDGHHIQIFGFQISLVMVAVLSAALFFMPYIGLINWKESNIPWDLMIFSCGAYAVGLSLDASGAASFLLNKALGQFDLAAMNPFVLYMIVMFIASFSHLVFTSKTVRVVILIPTIVGLAKSLGLNPLTMALPAAFTICDSITLPPHCKPNLIFYSSGYFNVKEQFVYGMLVLFAKWLILGAAYFTWFRVVGIV